MRPPTSTTGPLGGPRGRCVPGAQRQPPARRDPLQGAEGTRARASTIASAARRRRSDGRADRVPASRRSPHPRDRILEAERVAQKWHAEYERAGETATSGQRVRGRKTRRRDWHERYQQIVQSRMAMTRRSIAAHRSARLVDPEPVTARSRAQRGSAVRPSARGRPRATARSAGGPSDRRFRLHGRLTRAGGIRGSESARRSAGRVLPRRYPQPAGRGGTRHSRGLSHSGLGAGGRVCRTLLAGFGSPPMWPRLRPTAPAGAPARLYGRELDSPRGLLAVRPPRVSLPIRP